MVVSLFVAFPFLFEGHVEDVVQFIIERINFYVGGNGEQVSYQILPTFKIGELRGNITSFSQFDNEPIYELWKRYKDLIRKCSHHGLPF